MLIFYIIGCILAAYLLNKKFNPIKDERKRRYFDSPMLVIGSLMSWFSVFIIWYLYRPEHK